MIKITDSQRALILLAIDTQGRIESYPDNLKGGARAAVVRGLLREDLIAADGSGYALTDAGYEAVGHQLPEVANAEEAGDYERTGSDMVSNDDSVADADADADAINDADATVASDLGPNDETAGRFDCAEANTPNPPVKRAQSKLDQVVGLLLRPQGATIAQVMEATEWQQHSVRGFFAGTVRKKGYVLSSTKQGKEERVYRIQPKTKQLGADE
ncbi:DUF3489 domain-containing protein [Lysobacter sp. Root690]|uniref:DUF3489 domain-containing protein n=1 Tax=Lysobacter sp. Root690 TaxID=1736588 RepID=UPI0006FC7FA5|nr:DUF3489 domain-containing protein [Lysobacter sp. Root690]KRB08044.1 hypothetical protein ASD86_09625 [Lysobacter sp. Root690]